MILFCFEFFSILNRYLPWISENLHEHHFIIKSKLTFIHPRDKNTNSLRGPLVHLYFRTFNSFQGLKTGISGRTEGGIGFLNVWRIFSTFGWFRLSAGKSGKFRFEKSHNFYHSSLFCCLCGSGLFTLWSVLPNNFEMGLLHFISDFTLLI